MVHGVSVFINCSFSAVLTISADPFCRTVPFATLQSTKSNHSKAACDLHVLLRF